MSWIHLFLHYCPAMYMSAPVFARQAYVHGTGVELIRRGGLSRCLLKRMLRTTTGLFRQSDCRGHSPHLHSSRLRNAEARPSHPRVRVGFRVKQPSPATIVTLAHSSVCCRDPRNTHTQNPTALRLRLIMDAYMAAGFSVACVPDRGGVSVVVYHHGVSVVVYL